MPRVPRMPFTVLASIAATAVVVSAASVQFQSTYKAPGAEGVSFFGKKVAALVISNDQSMRMGAEEALAKELTALGMQGIATYRIAPREVLENVDTAKTWIQEKTGVEGVVALRPVSVDKRTTYTPSMWMGGYYNTFWGYYGYGWSQVYVPGGVSKDTFVVVENTVYSVPKNELLWAAVVETENPKNLQQLVADIVKAVVKEMQKQGLAKKPGKLD
ncbi:MAG TPA: hypothetical protein VFV78_03895 [Vicinamibacterales bacterium]|nr:hypothetical protein [Vicinamibacterales bacterium]